MLSRSPSASLQDLGQRFLARTKSVAPRKLDNRHHYGAACNVRLCAVPDVERPTVNVRLAESRVKDRGRRASCNAKGRQDISGGGMVLGSAVIGRLSHCGECSDGNLQLDLKPPSVPSRREHWLCLGGPRVGVRPSSVGLLPPPVVLRSPGLRYLARDGQQTKTGTRRSTGPGRRQPLPLPWPPRPGVFHGVTTTKGTTARQQDVVEQDTAFATHTAQTSACCGSQPITVLGGAVAPFRPELRGRAVTLDCRPTSEGTIWPILLPTPRHLNRPAKCRADS